MRIQIRRHKKGDFRVYFEGQYQKTFPDISSANLFVDGAMTAKDFLLPESPDLVKQDEVIREGIKNGLTMPIDVYENGKL